MASVLGTAGSKSSVVKGLNYNILITKLFLFTSPGGASESCCWLRFHCLSPKKAEGSSSAAATQGGKKMLNVILTLLLISMY